MRYKKYFILMFGYTLIFINLCFAKSFITLHSEENQGHVLIDASSSYGTVSKEKREVKSEINSNISPPKSNDARKIEPIITQFALNNSHYQIMVDWAGAGSKVVICVSKDREQNVNSTTNVYISYDYGKTFQDKSEGFKIGNKHGIIYKFYKNEKFTDRFIFADVINKYLFVTNDYGHTIYQKELEFTPSEISIHPSNSLLFLAMDKEDKMKKLWITMDFGETFKVLSLYVKSYYWSQKESKPILYIEREEPESENTVIVYNSFDWDELKHETLVEDVQDFIVKDNFLFAIKREKHLLGSEIHRTNLQLWISYKGGPFLLAQFPNNLTHYHYYVADVSEGQIMICVFHGISSNLYVSSVPRSSQDQVKFSLSLERIFYYNPDTNWNNTWLNKKSDEAFADLHKVKGIRGVFIASQLFENYTKMSTRLGPEYLTSLITFDQGGEWVPINAPKLDSSGRKSNCSLNHGCSLHISQELSKLFPGTQSKPILTTGSAPGFILSSGTIGTSLKGNVGVYLSVNAGVTWYEVLSGNYLFTFGDHGGIMIAVHHFRSKGETNEIIYSVDEGETWQSHIFFPEEIRVYGLMTEPGENTTVFTLFGSKLEKHEWIIVQIDMSPIFQSRCTSEDFKPWIPFDSLSNRYCLLGRREEYERRAPKSLCYYGVDYDRPVSVVNCPCSREDYECDFGFVVKSSDSKAECVKDKYDVVNPLVVPLSCKEGTFYNRTKGYRKIPGDYCIDGLEELYNPYLTPCPVKEEKEFILVSTRKSILRYDLLNPDDGLQALPLPNINVVIALDFHLKNNCLYWSDTSEKKIMRQCFDGEHQMEALVDKNLFSVEGLALDWVSLNLYFTDGELKIVDIVNVNSPKPGSMRKTLLKEPDVDLPRGIAVHPVRGYMFLTDWSEKKPMVARANLDGKNLEVLFGKNIVGWPNGITVDFETEKIFWADAKLDYIASSDLDGKNLNKIITESDHVKQPFSVGVHKSMVYWDDWTTLQILQADKYHGWGVKPLNEKLLAGLVDLKVFGHWSQTGSNSCGDGSKNKCQFFCIGIPGNGYSCVCPSWLKTVNVGDQTRCVCTDGSEPTQTGACKTTSETCGNNFKCENGYCIPKTMLCDMDNDCGDFSDEKNCGKNTCEPSSWECTNGHCISPAWKCDADNDCGDNSDEEGCEYPKCSDHEFTCKNKRCIDKNWVCDLQDDCRDGSDEANCTVPHSDSNSCKTFHFQCKSSGTCLPISWQCDGEEDCPDSSDEKDCESHNCTKINRFQCSSNKCIYRNWVCDGDNDCEGGEDEKNCSSTSTPTSVPKPPFPQPPFLPGGENHTCSSFEFRCTNGNCIPFWWRCDGAYDCPDGSDEVGCAGENSPTTVEPTKTTQKHACREDQMECANGECIWEAWVCDGANDCSNGEDEKNCSLNMHCLPDEFRCWHVKGCIEVKLRCNGLLDCADGSDEIGCFSIPSNKTDTVPNCLSGFFACDGGNCLPDRKKCDKNIDCIDMTDESLCHGNAETYQVENLKKKRESNTSLSFEWSFNPLNSNETLFEFLPSCIIKEALGNSQAWKNGSWIHQKNYTFNDLNPFTTYILKVYVREKKSNLVFEPAEVLTMTTTSGIPSSPTNIRVSQEEDKLCIEWDKPLKPNGVIVSYKIYISPPEPAKQIEVEGDTYKLFYFPPQFKKNFTIWMTCSNSEHSSSFSELHYFATTSVDSSVTGLKVSFQNKSEVFLVWDPIPNIEGYVVAYDYPENRNFNVEIVQNVTKPEIKLKNIAPGLKYVFKVRGYNGKALGPDSILEFEAPGTRLPGLSNVRKELQKNPGTSVRISWEQPPYKQKYLWEYEIIWGKTINELKERKNVNSTKGHSYVVKHLDACEEYMMLVMISGPIGVGPASKFKIRTKEDVLAPPKNLAVKAQGNHMIITWLPPCPQDQDDTLNYLVTITETFFNKSYYFNVPTKVKSSIQGHSVEMHYGGKYRVVVKTHLNNSRSSEPALVNGPTIPPPFELTYNPSDGSFFWRDNQNLPSSFLSEKHSYILHLVREDINSSEGFEVEVLEPPYKDNYMDSGQIYLASVAFKDKDGYLSEKSQHIRVEKPIGDALVVTETSVMGVAISITVVMLILVGVVVVMAVRHKRLARSFSAFANSHYDRAEGTTHITTDHNLDDDDSPMIRGFSDDEPLVIA